MNDMDYHMDGLSHVRMITSDTHNHQWWCRMITNDTDNHQWQCTVTTNDMAYHQWYHRTILLLVKIFFLFFIFIKVLSQSEGYLLPNLGMNLKSSDSKSSVYTTHHPGHTISSLSSSLILLSASLLKNLTMGTQWIKSVGLATLTRTINSGESYFSPNSSRWTYIAVNIIRGKKCQHSNEQHED